MNLDILHKPKCIMTLPWRSAGKEFCNSSHRGLEQSKSCCQCRLKWNRSTHCSAEKIAACDNITNPIRSRLHHIQRGSAALAMPNVSPSFIVIFICKLHMYDRVRKCAPGSPSSNCFTCPTKCCKLIDAFIFTDCTINIKAHCLRMAPQSHHLCKFQSAK